MTARQDQDTRPIAARDVAEGMALDLYGDKYADPHRDPGKALEFEFALVEGTEFEKGRRGSTDCVVIYTGAVNFACPPDHTLYVMNEAA